MQFKYKPFISLSLGLLVVSCAPVTPPSVGYDSASQNKIISFKDPGENARVWFFGGDKKGSLFGDRPHGFSPSLYLNAIMIAKLHPDDVLVFDVKPGFYSFGWGLGSNQPSSQYQVNVQKGELVILRGDYNMGAGAYFGVIGNAVAGPGTSVVRVGKTDLPPKTIVAPQNCQPSICTLVK